MGRLGDYPKLEVRGRFLRVKAPLCRVVPRAANRNKHDCRWQSYLYYAVTPSGVTAGVYAIDTVKAIVRYSPTRTNRTPPPSHASVAHLPLHAGRLFSVPSALRQFLPVNTPIWGYSLRLLLKTASPQGFSCGDAILISFWIQSFALGYSLHRRR